MPHIIVKLWPGETEQQKAQLAEGITRSFAAALHYGEESVSIAFEEVPVNEWSAKVYGPEIVGKASTLYKEPGYPM